MVWSGPASAQTFGHAGQLTLGLEDVSGYFSESHVYKNGDNVELDDTHSDFSLFLRDGARVSAHYFAWPQVSLGGTIGFESQGGTVEQPDGPGHFNVDYPRASTFLFLGQAGYALNLSPQATFWVRGGPGYRRQVMPRQPWDDRKVTESALLFGGDLLFVYSPVPVVGLYAGPQALFTLVGRHSEEGGNDPDFSHSGHYTRLGLGLGVLVSL